MPRPTRLPKPFVKNSISISTDATGSNKEWREIDAYEVQVGDIVQGRNRGLVVDTAEDGTFVTLSFTNGGAERLFHDTPVTAFTEVRDGLG